MHLMVLSIEYLTICPSLSDYQPRSDRDRETGGAEEARTQTQTAPDRHQPDPSRVSRARHGTHEPEVVVAGLRFRTWGAAVVATRFRRQRLGRVAP